MLATLLFGTYAGTLEQYYIGPLLPLIIAFFFISITATGILYMLGNFFQSQDLIGMAKDNLSSLAMSILILVLFFALFNTFSTITNAIACGGSCADHVLAAEMSLEILRTKLMGFYFQLYFYEIIFGFLSTIGFSIPIPALSPATLATFLISMPSISFSPLSGLTPLSNAHTVIVEAIGTALLMTYARATILEFIRLYLFPFFALGLVLRSFVFTRRTGASLLALTAVAYFIYPVAVLFTNYMMFEVYKPADFSVVPTGVGYCNDPQTTEEIAQDFTHARDDVYSASIGKTTTKWYMFWTFLLDAARFVADFINMLLKTIFRFNMFHVMFFILSPVMFSTFFDFVLMEVQVQVQFLVIAFFNFFMEIIITITMYRSISAVMEGESEIFGISKLM